MSLPLESGPTIGTPTRLPDSVRRTITFDAHRPDGADGRIVMFASGRDLYTPVAGPGQVIAAATIALHVASHDGFVITSISSNPERGELSRLSGSSARQGFRREVRSLGLPRADPSDRLLSTMLMDVPITINLSRLAVLHRQARLQRSSARQGETATTAHHPVDICAGWTASSMMRGSVRWARPALLHDGVLAPPIVVSGDPLAWHTVGDVPADGYRRWRRLDLVNQPETEMTLAIEGIFRDSYFDEQAVERIEHEYSFDVTLDRTTTQVISCSARPRVLPAPDCARAAAGAGQLVGQPLAWVGDRTRERLVGGGSCTHLSDTLSLLGDCASLVDVLRHHG